MSYGFILIRNVKPFFPYPDYTSMEYFRFSVNKDEIRFYWRDSLKASSLFDSFKKSRRK